MREGRFREDLFYRLNVFPITVPPLRERRQDIPLLVWAFVEEFSKTMGKTIRAIAKDSMETLESYSWPGNIRELRNVIERAMITGAGPTLHVARRAVQIRLRPGAWRWRTSKGNTSSTPWSWPAGTSEARTARPPCFS